MKRVGERGGGLHLVNDIKCSLNFYMKEQYDDETDQSVVVLIICL